MEKKRDRTAAVPRLRSICFELDAFAYLLRLKGRDDVPPLEIEEINYGTGKILERLTNRLKRVMVDLEEAEIARASSKTSSLGESDLKCRAD